MKRSAVLVFVMVATVALLAGQASAQGDRTGITETTIKIGFFGALTGSGSLWGYPTINGARMVYEDVNRQGGIHGRKIEYVIEDDQCDPARAVATVKKLIHRDRVFMLHGGSCSSAVIPIRAEVFAGKTPTMVLVATADRIVQEKPNEWIFRAFLPGSYDGVIIADFLATMPGVKRVALVAHADEHAASRTATLIPGLKKHGLELIANETIDAKIADATAQVLRVKALNPDGVVLLARPAEFATFLRDRLKHGLDVPVLGWSAADFSTLLERLGSAEPLANVYLVNVFKGPVDSPAMKPWRDLLHTYFPQDKVQDTAFMGTSGALAVVEALRRAGRDLTREGFVAALREIRDVDGGPMACRLSFSADDHDGCRTGTIWTMVQDEIVNVGPTWRPVKK